MLTASPTSNSSLEANETASPVAVSLPLRIACGVLILAGIWLRLGFLEMRPFWDDEAFTYFISRDGMRGIWEGIACDSAPPLFYILELGMIPIFGNSEFGLRMISALSGVALIPFGMWLARQIWDVRAAWVTGALLASAPTLIYQSQEARFYSLLTLQMLAAAWCLWHFAKEPGWKWGLGAVLAGSLAIWTHYPGAFIVVFAGVAYLCRTRKQWIPALIPGAVLTVVVGTLMPILSAQKVNYKGVDVTASMYHPGLAFPAAAMRTVMMLGNGGYPEGKLRLLGFAAFLLALAVTVVLCARTAEGRSRLAFPVAALSVILVVWQLGGVFHTWPIRDNFIGVLTPAAVLILAGAVWTASRHRFAAAVPVVALAVMWSGTALLAVGEGRFNPDFRKAASIVAESGDTGVILARPWGDLACYKYYDRRTTPVAVFGVDPRTKLTLEAQVVKASLVDVSQVVGHQDRIWVVGKESGTQGFAAMEQQLTAAGYRRSREEKLRGVWMFFWERGSAEVAAR